MNYKNINYKLLRKYKKILVNELQDLKCKGIGEYFGGSKFTNQDQARYEQLELKVNKINKIIH